MAAEEYKVWDYRIDRTSMAVKVQQVITDGVKLYTELVSDADTNREVLYKLVKSPNKPLYDYMNVGDAKVDINRRFHQTILEVDRDKRGQRKSCLPIRIQIWGKWTPCS